MKLNNPYYFQKRMLEKDPVLIMTEKKGKFKEYSRICHEHVRRQPVILTQSELDTLSKDLSDTIGSIFKLDYKVDKELIGGLKLQLGSFMIDTSIKNKLRKYEQAMIEN